MTQSDHRHPLHPGLVHMPIAFLFSAQALDVVYGLATNARTATFAASIYNVKPYLSDITRSSHLLLSIGLITAIPAILSGAYELIQLLQRQAVADKLAHADTAKEKKTVVSKTHPKVKMAFLHAAVMDVVVAAAVFNCTPGVMLRLGCRAI